MTARCWSLDEECDWSLMTDEQRRAHLLSLPKPELVGLLMSLGEDVEMLERKAARLSRQVEMLTRVKP